ncbi:60S ribosomal protein L32-like [Chionomys nivalis]|uniref:60S ribosomal protein L32-like n=1 Tax=Chionomys nivalis TaxID=269649 RepID=UPI0025946530|nr:60S ribosomal protein L32-like [Chionomys nivalis]
MAALRPLVKAKVLKNRTKKFTQHQSDGYVKIKRNWLKPRGVKSSIQRRFKGRILMSSIGYGNSKKTKHICLAVVTNPNATRVTNPNVTRVTNPNATRVTNPNATRVTNPNVTRVTNPNATRVTNPNATRVTNPNTTRVTDPNTTRANNPNAGLP